jgi:hypothetical protein
MVPITIDFSQFIQAFNIPETEVKQLVGNVMGELTVKFAEFWKKEASSLKSSREQYQKAISTEKIDDYNYFVKLNGWLPNAVESGLDGFDMKSGFANSPKAHHTANGGWYLTIPFRSASVGANADSSLFSGVLPSAVYSQAKQLDEGESLNTKDLSAQYQEKKVRPRVITKSQVFEEYQHKNSIYEGIKKNIDVSGRGTYSSFRRVSNKNEGDNSWIHSGIKAHNFAEKALETMNIDEIVDLLMTKYVNEL